jgi:hypothetical protein
VCMIVQEGFTLVIQACVSHALIKSQPPRHYLLFLYHHASLIFNNSQYRALYSIHIETGCFNIFHSLPFSFPLQHPIVSSDRCIKRRCSLFHSLSLSRISTYTFILTYVFMCVCIL